MDDNNIIIFLSLFISYAIFIYVRNFYRLAKHFPRLKKPELTIKQLRKIAREKGDHLPNIAIFVPARNEGEVIGNTVRNLAELDYPKNCYQVFIIVDERELKDDVEIVTKDVVRQLSGDINKQYGVVFIRNLEVPDWYGGVFGGHSRTYKKSTKGRALNYALQKLYESEGSKHIEMIGVLDADGRFDKNVLKHIAYQRLKGNVKVLQGPVFQITNFNTVSTICILAGLEMAIHHMTEQAAKLLNSKRKLKLLAGTNCFLDTELLIKLGGWNCDSLVEDAELAVRIYAQTRIRPQWLSWPEVEQTTPSFAIYRKQRERWFRGNLDLAQYVRKSNIPFWDKLTFISKIYIGFIRIPLDIGAMVVGFILLFSGVLRHLDLIFQIALLFWFILSIIILDFYGLIFRKLANYIDPQMDNSHKIVQSFKFVCYMPLFVFVQSIPKITAVLKHIGKSNDTWYKTERSKEHNSD